jgi:hypothetical protein
LNPPTATLVLVLLAGTLFILPLLPAIGELRLKRDAKPLQVIQKHSGEIKYFAAGFRECIQPLLPALQQCVQEGRNVTGHLPGGEEYLLLGRPVDPDFEFPKEKQSCPVIVAAGTDTNFPSGLTFAKEVYAAGQVMGQTEYLQGDPWREGSFAGARLQGNALGACGREVGSAGEL